jgi:hypothetical protein
MDTNAGLAAVHAAANLGSRATAITLQPSVKGVAEPDPAAAGEVGPEMVGMPKKDYEANLASANAAGRADGAKTATARIKSIISAPEAKGRESLAHSIAFDTELNQEQAIAMLKAAPEAQKVSRLDGNVPAPKVDANEGGDAKASASAGLAAATARLIEKTYGKPAA